MDFTYNDGGLALGPDAFRISPSQFEMFFSRPHQWYNEQVLKNTPEFKGNTASELGTIVHTCAEAYGKGEQIDSAIVEEHIDSLEGKEDVDTSIIKANWKPMVMALVNQYLKDNMPTNTEDFLYHELQPGYFPSGSCDAYINQGDSGVVIDYKTTSQLSPPTTIPYHYKLQLLIYAYLYNKQGNTVDRVRIVYITRNVVGRVSEKTGKPLKDYPSKVGVVTETITSEDMAFIESLLNLCIDTVKESKEHPQLTYMLFKDYRLKDLTVPSVSSPFNKKED